MCIVPPNMRLVATAETAVVLTTLPHPPPPPLPGLLAAGYNFITLGGMGFAENGDPQAVPGFPNIPRQNITRNATGYLQADASRFPGPGSTAACLDEQTVLACRKKGFTPAQCGCKNGNAGRENLTNYLRQMGFKFGSYTQPIRPGNGLMGLDSENIIPKWRQFVANLVFLPDQQFRKLVSKHDKFTSTTFTSIRV